VDFWLQDELAAHAAPQLERLEALTGAPLDDASRFVFALSEFALHTALAQHEWWRTAHQAGAFARPLTAADIRAMTDEALAGVEAMPALQAALRRLRNRCQLWIVWRHLAARAALEETTAILSDLADILIDRALDKVHAWTAVREGNPVGSESGVPQRLVVLALGKLGARELNLSSDVDLIFAFPESGTTDRGRTNQQFFVRLGQQLIQALDQITPDGFAFRVDMRLRPFGASGPLAMSFPAMEDYFLSQGRDWERYAFIKARACAGDVEAGAALLKDLRPFVYRRYLDFGAIDALRDMKSRIQAERHDVANLKLGPGGIRDVEFTVQVQQLIWGGRQRELQQTALLAVLPELERLGHLAPAAVADLRAGYRFLRDAEHSLQAEADRQTQTLPAADVSQLRLARSLGFADYAGFTASLDAHRARIAAVFATVVGSEAPSDSPGLAIWVEPERPDALAAFGFRDPDGAQAVLTDLIAARDRSSVGAEGRQRLDRLMPGLLDALRRLDEPDLALARVAPVLKAIMRRSAYLALLYENPVTLAHFLDLAVKSRWLAEEVTRHPAFFDALLDQRQLRALPSRAQLATELADRIAAAEPDGAERVLDALREFKEFHVFNVALAEVRGTLPLMNASDYLTFLAEAVLERSLDLAWRENVGKFDAFPWPQPFIIVGYGKLGGIELGPGSDLDLVFIHDLPGESAQFLHRLVRRLLHVITVPTYIGTLYEVDMRLRPSGNAGTMVSSLESFRDYQRGEAWTWEHQALVRARAIVGDPVLIERFEAVRREILCLPRDPAQLREDVLKMRARMAGQAPSAGDLKRSSGGMVDIEFMVQYLVLAHAHAHPEMAAWSDNVRILETAGRLGLVSFETAESLRAAYLALRAEWHRSVLDLPDTERAAQVLESHRDQVQVTWRALFGTD
jgi:[glutamine synthetase] adenylyltransferase / [glutamine synthetase]-adenylyl-L-tyrosine phosphorylase